MVHRSSEAFQPRSAVRRNRNAADLLAGEVMNKDLAFCADLTDSIWKDLFKTLKAVCDRQNQRAAA